MVSIRNLLLLGTTVLSAIAVPAPVDSGVAAHEVHAEARNKPGRFSIFVDRGTARAIFMMGANLPQSLLDSFATTGVGPAKELFAQFKDYVLSAHNSVSYFIDPLHGGVAGGLQGVYTDFVGDIGIGIELAPTVNTADNFQKVIDALTDWAKQDGATVDVINSAKVALVDFSKMGASQKRDKIQVAERSRSNTCPANVPNLLTYGTDSPADNSWQDNFRFMGTCDAN